jgi:hypothetical protein
MTNTSQTPATQGAPDVDVYDIISYVETKHNSRAVRFEPATYEKLSVGRTDSQKAIIATIQARNKCSWGTALMIYSTSFGSTQLMGFNMYGPEVNVQTDIIGYCDDEIVQVDSFYRFLKQVKLDDITVAQLAASSVARMRFAVTYNGSPAYAAEIIDALKSYHFSVVE